MSKKDAKIMDKAFFNQLAKDVRDLYKAWIFDPKGRGKKAKDVNGSNYKSYKNPQDPYSYGNLKKTGTLKGIDQTPQHKKFKDSNAPVLTGQLMNSFDEMRATGKGFGFGTITQKGKVKKLHDMGRSISTNAKPVPSEIAGFIMDELTKDTKGAFKKIRKAIKRKKININIGK